MRFGTDIYMRIAAAAQGWASACDAPRHLHFLAGALADEAAAYGRGVYPDEATLRTFGRLGCFLCRRFTDPAGLPCCTGAGDCLLGLPAAARPHRPGCR